jgi:cytochrome b
MIQVRIWDWPTRIFHWLLATLVLALVITGNVGGNAMVFLDSFGGFAVGTGLAGVNWPAHPN